MSLAPVTTGQQQNKLITTTVVDATSSKQVTPPALSTRSAGWHANSFGFDWNKRSDHHKYLVKNGLPEVHAAIINDDWDLALELICPEDFGLLWLPPASQSPSKNNHSDLDSANWTVELLSQNENTRNNAILAMAIHNCGVTSIDTNCLYGANLLNLCLLKPARSDVLQHVISMAATQAPKYLNLPDAVGRTPLWIAVKNQDHASIQLLLKAGADPILGCKFSAEGELKPPLYLAAKYANKEIFRDLLRAVVDQGKKFTPYDYDIDPLYLKRWASDHSSEDVLWLADKVESLCGPLLCCEDISGSSYFYRSVIDGSLGQKLKNGNEDLFEWLKSLDISTVASDDIESSPLYAAVSNENLHTYFELANFFSTSNKARFSTKKMDEAYKKAEEKFILSRTSEDFDQYLDHFPKRLLALKSTQKKILMEMQYRALLRNQREIGFNDYARLVKSVWSFISDDEKNILFLDAAINSNERMEFIFSMLDCSLSSSTIESLMQKASAIGNKAAFEFAADLSYVMRSALELLKTGEDKGYGMFQMAIEARSLKWVEKLIDAGLNRQKVIAESGNYMVMLADLDPHGLSEKLKGLNYIITPRMVEQASTEAGKQALTALMTNASNNT